MLYEYIGDAHQEANLDSSEKEHINFNVIRMESTESSLKGENLDKVQDIYKVGTRREPTDSLLSQSGIELFEKNSRTSALPDDTYRIHQIMRAVVHMDSKLKTPFSMFIGGYDHTEIAEKLHIPVETVRKRIGSAREELQKILTFGNWQKN